MFIFHWSKREPKRDCRCTPKSRFWLYERGKQKASQAADATKETINEVTEPIQEQAKAAAQTTKETAKQLYAVDNTRLFASLAAVATGLHYGPRGLSALIRNARQRRAERALKSIESANK